MEDLQILRKSRANSTSFKGFEKPVMSINMPRGVFVFNRKAVELISLTNESAIMFALSKKDNCAYVFKEEPEPDSYYPKHSKDGIYRFTCKDLANHFTNFFEFSTKKNFDIEVINGQFKITSFKS